MKALSLWQPWASAIAVGAKRYETRGWPAVSGGRLYSGWLAIHASVRTKEPKKEGGMHLAEKFDHLLMRSQQGYVKFVSEGLGKFDVLPLGKVVAVAWLNRCHPTEKVIEDPSQSVTPDQMLWGNYSPGRYAWEFTETWILKEPLPVRGEQKLFDVYMPANWQHQARRVY